MDTETFHTIQDQREEGINHLLQEIIAASSLLSPDTTSHHKRDSGFLYEKSAAPRRLKRPFLPLSCSIALLGGIFLGTMFGFYWGKIERETPPPPYFIVIEEQLRHLAQKIDELYASSLSPLSTPTEIIEPLELPDLLERLSPKKLL